MQLLPVSYCPKQIQRGAKILLQVLGTFQKICSSDIYTCFFNRMAAPWFFAAYMVCTTEKNLTDR